MDIHSKSTFLSAAAECGSNLVAPLIAFGCKSDKINSIISHITLASSLLLAASKQVDLNSKFFNDSFPEKLGVASSQCIKEFEAVRDALSLIEKETTTVKEEVSRTGRVFRGPRPSKPWKMLLWAMQMENSDFWDLQSRLEKCADKAWMIQSLVSLVCIQKFAQERKLDDSELAALVAYKKRMGDFLDLLRESEVATVMAFKLTDNTVQAINATQLARENQEDDIADDASSTLTACATPVPLKKLNFCKIPFEEYPNNTKAEPASVPPPPPPPVNSCPPPPLEDKAIYEMYHFNEILAPTKAFRTTFKLLPFSIPFITTRSQSENRYYLNKIPITPAELKTYMAANTSNEVPGIDALLGLPPITSNIIYQMIESKNNCPPHFQRKVWTVKSITPIQRPSKRSKWSVRQSKVVQPVGFVVIIKSEESDFPVRGCGPPPPPRIWPKPPGPPVIILPRRGVSRKDSRERMASRERTKIELTKKEIEGVVNDFLATVSTLYDGVPEAERCKVFRELEVDDDSDASSFVSSSSGSSRSLVDD